MSVKKHGAGVEPTDDLPNYRGFSGKFMLKSIAAHMAMGFGSTDITSGMTARGP
jgi:hypothetical protein